MHVSDGRPNGMGKPVIILEMSHVEHRAAAPTQVRCYVITVSDTRTPETDTGGQLLRELLVGGGHQIAGHAIVRDDPITLREAIQEQLEVDHVDAVLTTGGTGISRRDGTFEVVSALLDKRIDGFGELFRALSYDEIGPSAMLSRACASTSSGKIVITLPGSRNAVRLGITKLVLPELGHLVREVTR